MSTASREPRTSRKAMGTRRRGCPKRPFFPDKLFYFNTLSDEDRGETGLSKSSVHRLKQAILRRDRYPESWFGETDEGQQWLIRLVVATLYTFGFKRGVGAETLSEFLLRLRLESQIGCSPSA
jgi:hypothetical protein